MGCRIGCLLAFFATLGIFADSAFGQARDPAALSGVVTDAQGAAVPLAKVTVTSDSTAAARTLVTDQSGNYVFSLLPVGVYTLTVEISGFRKFQQTNVILQANENIRANATMDVGNVSESVTVESNAAQVDTRAATLNHTVDSKSIVDLPLNGRNPADMVRLAPGVASRACHNRAPSGGSFSLR